MDSMPAAPIFVDRFFLPERNFMLIQADFGPLLQARSEYLERHGLAHPPIEASRMLRRTLQAHTLWSTFMPNGTTTAWSLLLADREWRMFFAADSGEERCVARWSPFEAEHKGSRMLFDCQSQRPHQLLQRSVFEPTVSEIEPLIDEFFQHSQQTQGRMFWEQDGNVAQMLVALADWDSDWYERLCKIPQGELTSEEEWGELRRIGPAQRWKYECGCDPERLRQAILAAARENVSAVFGNEASVDIECPRCGREHSLRRP
jgi:hypothetical protein